jgi:hypothetical protein
MALPKVAMPTATVDVDGQAVHVRGLTRGENAEVSRLIDQKNIEAAEIFCLTKGTDTPADDAADWYADTNNADVERVLNAIGDLTRLDEGASKSGEAGLHAGNRGGVGFPPGREAGEDGG